MPRRRQPTLRERRLAAELRFLRETRQTTLAQVAEAIGWKTAKLGRVETAVSGVSLKDLGVLLDYYGVAAERREQLMERASTAGRRQWAAYEQFVAADYTEYLEMEVLAVGVRAFDTSVLYGRLQTESYARAIMEGHSMGLLSPGEIDRRLEIRMARQGALTRQTDPLHVWVIVAETVLDTTVGAPEVMVDQMRHLLDLAELPNIDLQVLPAVKGAHPGLTGAFAILEFPESWEADVVYLETMTRNTYLADPHEVHRYSLAYRHLSAMALDPGETKALLARRVRAQEAKSR
ncbi:helix-turn-helix transcriptional regulator [Actinopolymorpha sp. B17G11]|uniref:helix-turn-helix domain-containing protein n=1 Tax=unclassified Actinopolymorpha TaxID=2627063 RepID=UPI0032D8B5F9